MSWQPAEKVFCVVRYFRGESYKYQFKKEFNKDPPARSTIDTWVRKFKQTGTLQRKKGSGRPPINSDIVEEIRTVFENAPETSIRRAACQVNSNPGTVYKILRNRLKLKAYRYSLVQCLQESDFALRAGFASLMLEKLSSDPNFLHRIVFSDEAAFHICGKVNRHNMRIWGSENPRKTIEHQRDSPKIIVWCAMSSDTIFGPFFFRESTVNSANYLDMLQNFAFPQFPTNVIFQQDGAPPHWGSNVREALDDKFPDSWIGRGGPISWPPRSPDITPLDYFLWGYVKNKVYSSPVKNIEELKERIETAINNISPELLARVWKNLEIRLRALKDNGGGHIENLHMK